MNCHWVRDRIAQKQFKPMWEKGAENSADHFTKHHPPAHHTKMIPTYSHHTKELQERQA